MQQHITFTVRVESFFILYAALSKNKTKQKLEAKKSSSVSCIAVNLGVVLLKCAVVNMICHVQHHNQYKLKEE